ncbi:MAG: ribonuclease R [Ignavibacteria bacterium]|nr:ribonuclease R [Ignavibacteria bacterium]
MSHSSLRNFKQEIINYFRRHPSSSLSFNDLRKKLGVDKSKKKILRHSLAELVNQNTIFKEGKFYRFREGSTFYLGEVISDSESPSGYSVEIIKEDGVYIYPVRRRNLSTALVGDKVEVSVIEFLHSSEKEAFVENIVERAVHRFTGKVQSVSRDYAFVLTDDRLFRNDIYVPSDLLKGAKNGDKVVVQITRWDYPDISPEGKVIEVLGEAGDVETEFRVLIRKYNFNKSFPKTVREELRKMEDEGKLEINENELAERHDLRNEVTFTIDPEDAKDHDDAVSLKLSGNGNFLLGVHIADVSYYVSEGSELDKEALKRGTSVYLMNDVVPMLPEKLSNKICSLLEKKPRLTFSVIMEINHEGVIEDYRFVPSVIKSHKKFTYEEAQKVIDTNEGPYLEELKLMKKLHEILNRKRLAEGSIDFESLEMKTVIEKGLIKEIKPKQRLTTMRMIEDFMLAANRCAAEFIARNKLNIPFIFRVHDVPDRKKMKEVAMFVKQFGISLNPESKRSIQKMLESVKGRPEEFIVNDITIRSMSKAVYSEENIGHYGLGFNYYTHFTSPIRRYPDLVVHRIIKETLAGINSKRLKYYKGIVSSVSRHSTETEIKATQAEREAVKILQCQYMQKHINQVFSGIVSGITEYGVYVEMLPSMIEGMVRLRDLNDDYYILDEKNFQIVGRHRRKRYRIGDRVKVRISRVDVELRQIDLVMC